MYRLAISMTNEVDMNLEMLKKRIIDHWLFLFKEYEKVKMKQHDKISILNDFYALHNLSRQVFSKYYQRYKTSQFDINLLLPQKRGPLYSMNKIITPEIEDFIVELRKNGLNKAEIAHKIYDRYGIKPSLSRIYQMFVKHNISVMNKKVMLKRKRHLLEIIKHFPGELGHVDCHSLNYGILPAKYKNYCLFGLLDDYTRLVHVVIISDKTQKVIYDASIKCINAFKEKYNIQFEKILSDNGDEFGGGPEKNNKNSHLFEISLKKFSIQHICTSVQNPETNGKIERFWRTLKEELLDNNFFSSIEHLENALNRYCAFYNRRREHHGICQRSPLSMKMSEQ